MKIKFTEGPDKVLKEISTKSSFVPRIGETIKYKGLHDWIYLFIVVDVKYELKSNKLVPYVTCDAWDDGTPRFEMLQRYHLLPPHLPTSIA
jgi:hypothetical protein